MSNALTEGEDSLTAARAVRLLGRLTRREVVRHEEVFVMKILLAVDGSPFSEEAAREVARRPWPAGSELKVISVIEPPYAPEMGPYGLPQTYFDEMDKLAAGKASAAVEGALTILRAGEGEGLKLSSETPHGPSKQTIIEEAERWGADLIVVGSHGYGFWSRLLLGSVSQGLASAAPCSVEIVKVPAPTEGREA
jgi:nucleotide-binding universal stress UspA family protein